MSAPDRIDEADVIRLTERKATVRMYAQTASLMLEHCSDAAEPMWREMLEEASEELAKLDNPDHRW